MKLLCGLACEPRQAMLKACVPLLIFAGGQATGAKGFLQLDQSFAGERRRFLGERPMLIIDSQLLIGLQPLNRSPRSFSQASLKAS